jgi:hypothetical protein
MDLTKVDYNNLQPGGKRLLRQTSCRREYIIRISLKSKGWEGVGANYLAQDRDHWWFHKMQGMF